MSLCTKITHLVCDLMYLRALDRCQVELWLSGGETEAGKVKGYS